MENKSGAQGTGGISRQVYLKPRSLSCGRWRDYARKKKAIRELSFGVSQHLGIKEGRRDHRRVPGEERDDPEEYDLRNK